MQPKRRFKWKITYGYFTHKPFCWGYALDKDVAIRKCKRNAPLPKAMKRGEPMIFEIIRVDSEEDWRICNFSGSLSLHGKIGVGGGRMELVGLHVAHKNNAKGDDGSIALGKQTAHTCGCVE